MSEIKSNIEKLELYSDEHPFSLALRIRNFESEGDYKKFIKNCELLVRRSVEYKLWRGYIIDVLGINECILTNESNSQVTVDVHHHVPSLFVLIQALINKHIDNNEEFCTFDVATEAIKLHFRNKIGYVTLIKSLHEKFHNGFLGIPIEKVKGDYQYFIKEYMKYLDDESIDKINERLATKESNCNWSRDNYPAEAVGGSN
jgi:hypothetical protein